MSIHETYDMPWNKQYIFFDDITSDTDENEEIVPKPIATLVPHLVYRVQWRQMDPQHSPKFVPKWNENGHLSVTIDYDIVEESKAHTFDAYIMDTSAKGKRSYDIYLNDRNKCKETGYWREEQIAIDVEKYLSKDTTFKIYQVALDGIAKKIGTILYW